MTLLLPCAISFLLCQLLASRHSPLKIFDAPNERSLHDVPTAHTGGVAIMLAVLIGWGWSIWLNSLPEAMGWIAAAALLVAAISFIDDVCELSSFIRLMAHALAAVVLLLGGLVIVDGWLGILLTWFAIVWMLNLYNFMDGMDGFAGGMTLFGFGFLACAGWLQGANDYALLAAVVAAAAAGFLPVNFPPAKLFMGDSGSATLGLMAAAFSLWGIRDGLFTYWFPLLVFSPFVVDASITLLRRALRRERIWQAHRTHYYQRLVQAGWGHRKTVLLEWILMLFAGLSGLLLLLVPEWTSACLLVWTGIYILLAIMADAYCKKRAGQAG